MKIKSGWGWPGAPANPLFSASWLLAHYRPWYLFCPQAAPFSLARGQVKRYLRPDKRLGWQKGIGYCYDAMPFRAGHIRWPGRPCGSTIRAATPIYGTPVVRTGGGFRKRRGNEVRSSRRADIICRLILILFFVETWDFGFFYFLPFFRFLLSLLFYFLPFVPFLLFYFFTFISLFLLYYFSVSLLSSLYYSTFLSLLLFYLISPLLITSLLLFFFYTIFFHS